MKKNTIVQLFARDFQEPHRIRQMCSDLSKSGFKVYRLLFRKKREKKEYNENFETIIVNKIGFLSTKPANEITFLDLFLFGIIGALKILKINRKEKIAILHCHRHSSLIPAFLSKAMGVKSKIILDYHDPWSGESTLSDEKNVGKLTKLKIKMFHFFEKISFRFIDHVIVVSDLQKELLKKKYGLDKKMFTRVTNSASTAEDQYFNPRNKNKKEFGWENKKIIMFTGCIVPYFGVDLLVESAPLVIKKVPNALFIIKIAEEIKEKEYYNFLKRMIKKNKIENHIKFIDEWMPAEKYGKFICSSDVGIICHKPTLLTKTADPDKLYEYLSSGIPIIATDLEIMKRYVKNGVNGLIVKHDPKEIANALIKILNNERLRKKMGKNSRKMRYDWKDDFGKLLKTYGALIKNE